MVYSSEPLNILKPKVDVMMHTMSHSVNCHAKTGLLSSRSEVTVRICIKIHFFSAVSTEMFFLLQPGLVIDGTTELAHFTNEEQKMVSS